MLRLRIVLAFILAALAVGACTSTQSDLAGEGQACDEDPQCAPPLVCACVLSLNPDPDGPDQIIQHGKCSKPGTKCIDAGVRDGASDGAGDAPADGSDGSSDAAPTDARDAGDASSGDAPAGG